MNDGLRILHIEPFSGISGDMLLGALIDLGVPLDYLEERLHDLGLEERVALRVERIGRGGLMGTRVEVVVDGEVEGPGGRHAPEGADRDGHGGGHHHGTPAAQVLERIEDSRLAPEIRDRSLEVFTRLIEAEARVHGSPPDRVHLHEVGAIDAVVDVVCSVAGVAMLEVERVISAPPCEGHGEVNTAHGVLPVPAPATAYLLEGVPVHRVDVPFELVTPTGAALLVTLADSFSDQISIEVERVGYGAGTREIAGRPNLLRASLGRRIEDPGGARDQVTILETVVDDALPEIWPYLIDRLLAAGARDAWLTPVIMKRGRPGIQLTVIADPDARGPLEQIIFEETGTLGIRTGRSPRSVLPRTAGTLATDLGPLHVKLSRLPGSERWRVHPEFEACREAAEKHGMALREVYALVNRAAAEESALSVEGEEQI